MRTLFLLGLGILCGAIGTVLFFTLDPTFEGHAAKDVVVGNASLTLDEDALSTLVGNEFRNFNSFTEGSVVKTDIRSDGLIKFNITVGTLGVGVRSSILVDPEVVEGRLQVNVVEASLGELALPDQVAKRIQAPLQERLDSLAGGFPYRLTAITTTDAQLTLQIAF